MAGGNAEDIPAAPVSDAPPECILGDGDGQLGQGTHAGLRLSMQGDLAAVAIRGDESVGRQVRIGPVPVAGHGRRSLQVLSGQGEDAARIGWKGS